MHFHWRQVDHILSHCVFIRPKFAASLLQIYIVQMILFILLKGVEIKFKNQYYPVIIAPTHIKELTEVHFGENGIWFGASVTLSQLDQILHKQIQTLPEHKTRVYAEIVEMLKWFAGHQIRNVSVSFYEYNIIQQKNCKRTAKLTCCLSNV